MEKTTEDNEKNEKKRREDDASFVVPSTMTSLNRFIAGGASGLLSRLVTHPMDTMKSRMQVGGSKTFLNINGAYKGFGAVAIGSPVASGMYFMGYETTKACLKSVRRDDDDQQTLVLENVLTGIVAQALAGIAYTPVDVVKERMQVSSVLPTHLKTNNGVDYRNALDAVRTILKNEGVKNGLMRGYWAQNFVWWPWSACYFAAYEKGLEMFRRTKSNAKEGEKEEEEEEEYYRYVSPHAASAFTAATCATVLTHPLDLCKTRVQTMTSSSSSSDSSNDSSSAKTKAGVRRGNVVEKLTMRRVFTDVVRKEGFFALYRGVWARILSVAPGSAISFYAYESIRKSGVLRLEDE
jgi:solute carrier family 25 citrate transporter 1